jgi:hypothetical protein
MAWSFAQRWAVLSSSPFPIGVDGYFYPVQLRSLMETGHLQYPASPLGFWLMLPFAAATDPITGAKLGAAFYTALVALPAYGVGARLGKSRGAGLVAAALATFSAGSAYMTIEFVKNGIGITMALTALWLVLRAIERRSRLRIAAAVVAIVAAILAHKMAAAIVVGIAVPAVLADATGRGALRGRRLIYAIAGLAIVGTVVIVVGIVAPQRFVSPGDVGLVGHMWTSDADWSLPVLANDRNTLRLGAEPLVGLVLALAAAAGLVVERKVWRVERVRGVEVTSWAVIALGIVIGLPWLAVDDPQGLGMRLRIVAFVPMALCATIVLRVVLRVILPLVAVRGERAVHAGICVVLAVLLAQRVPGSRTEGLIPMHPALVTGVQSLIGRVPDTDTIVVPERQIIFMVAWYTRSKISLRPDTVPIDERWRLMPRAFIIHDSPLDHALLAVRTRSELPRPLGLHPRDPNGLVLVAEPTWQYVLSTLSPSERRYWADWPTR